MIDALIAGNLFSDPKQGLGKNDSPYTTVAVRAADSNGDQMICNVIAFRQAARAALNALREGDSVALSGTLSPKVYLNREGEYKPGLDVVCHAVLTPYHINRTREAMTPAPSDNNQNP